MERQIRAYFDEEGVYVYQAFKPSIVEAALAHGTFAKGFNLERMTWIKPSFGWMLYRSGYASKHRQERILQVKIRHEGFVAILAQAIPTHYVAQLFETQFAWESALRRSEVRVQWDPDRDLRLRRLEHRAIQLGIRGQTVRHYVEDWIISLQDVTSLAYDIQDAVKRKNQQLPEVPLERVYPVEPAVARSLTMWEDDPSSR